jgi:cytidyltransferase-like protein
MLSFTKFFTEGLNAGKTILIFPGRFQPWHLGHQKYYKAAKQQFPQAQCYIATSEPNPKLAAKEPDRYPFNFEDKKRLMIATGVPENEIVKTVQPYKPEEILTHYDPYADKAIFLVGKKDMSDDSRFKVTPTSYFQIYKNINDTNSFKTNGYLVAPGTITFYIDGKPCTSATELRNEFKSGDEKKRKRIIFDVVGHYDEAIYNLFCMRLLK